MSDDNGVQDAQPAVPAQDAPVETPPAPKPAEKTDIKSLPDDIQTYIKELRHENRQHREAKEQAERAAREAETAKLTEQGEFKRLYEEAQAALAKLNDDLKAERVTNLRQKVAAAVKLPAELVDRLRGETEEELTADAETLLKAIPQSVRSATALAPGGAFRPSQDAPGNAIGGGGWFITSKESNT